MVRISRKQFDRIVAEALRDIPEEFRRALDNIEIAIEDWPTEAQLDDAGLDADETLFGLFEGTPLPERSPMAPYELPDLITIFQGPLEDACETEAAMRAEIQRTVIHEIAHYFGFDEERLAELGYD